MESFNVAKFRELTGTNVDFVQDNHSRSSVNVLRGIHYQIEHAQGKLVRVTEGAVFDVAVDLRARLPTLVIGMALSSTLKTKNNFGYLPVLAMRFWS